MSTVTLVDTSVLCELLQVPGKCDQNRFALLNEELDVRAERGERLVIPVTAVIETGNHIAQCQGDRHAAARRLVKLLVRAASHDAPWTVLDTRFDQGFLEALRNGDSTGEDLCALAARKVGAGDVAMLVERDQLRRDTALQAVDVWTLDQDLLALVAMTPR